MLRLDCSNVDTKEYFTVCQFPGAVLVADVIQHQSYFTPRGEEFDLQGALNRVRRLGWRVSQYGYIRVAGQRPVHYYRVYPRLTPTT